MKLYGNIFNHHPTLRVIFQSFFRIVYDALKLMLNKSIHCTYICRELTFHSLLINLDHLPSCLPVTIVKVCLHVSFFSSCPLLPPLFICVLFIVIKTIDSRWIHPPFCALFTRSFLDIMLIHNSGSNMTRNKNRYV